MCQLTFVALLVGITVTFYLEYQSEQLGVEACVESFCLPSVQQSTRGQEGVSHLAFNLQAVLCTLSKQNNYRNISDISLHVN